MHSSPSLAAAVIASVALLCVACSDSSEPERGAPATMPGDAAVKAGATPATKDASATAENMTQVGAAMKRPIRPNMPMNMGMDEDAAAPAGSTPNAADSGMPAKVDTTSCAVDSDCKTFDSMCGSCRCLVMTKQTEPPGCSEPEVMCVIAPCLNKRAVCTSGKCALKDVSPNSI